MADDKTETARLFNLLNSNQYEVKNLQYPADLESEGNGHFIMFLINVNKNQVDADSRIREGKEIDRSALERINAPDIFSETISRRNQDTATQKRGRELLKNNTKRINRVISMYMPEVNLVSYGLDYENIDLGAGVAALAGGASIADIAQSFDPENLGQNSDGSVNAGSVLQKSNSSNVLKKAVQLGALGDIAKNTQSAVIRQAKNPHMEFLFRGVQQRRFSFEFIFTPRSEKEAKNVYNIIREFKLNAIPEIKDNGLGVFMDFPAEFDVLFISNGKENKYLHRFSTSALTNITINYNQAGVNSMHKEIKLDGGDFGAAPTHINMRLDFAELELLSKQRIKEGY